MKSQQHGEDLLECDTASLGEQLHNVVKDPNASVSRLKHLQTAWTA